MLTSKGTCLCRYYVECNDSWKKTRDRLMLYCFLHLRLLSCWCSQVSRRKAERQRGGGGHRERPRRGTFGIPLPESDAFYFTAVMSTSSSSGKGVFCLPFALLMQTNIQCESVHLCCCFFVFSIINCCSSKTDDVRATSQGRNGSICCCCCFCCS